jgi:hypothetical protein
MSVNMDDLPDIEEMNEAIATVDLYMEKMVELANFVRGMRPIIDAVEQIG